MPDPSAQDGPDLAPNEIGRDQRGACVLLEEDPRGGVPVVARKTERDPEGRVDEDHASGPSGP
jgi:hypothetical protein